MPASAASAVHCRIIDEAGVAKGDIRFCNSVTEAGDAVCKSCFNSEGYPEYASINKCNRYFPVTLFLALSSFGFSCKKKNRRAAKASPGSNSGKLSPGWLVCQVITGCCSVAEKYFPKIFFSSSI